jgi:voltage-gated potassium channel
MPILYAVGVLLVNFGRSVYKAWQDPETRGTVYLALILIAVGTAFYHTVEGWTWIDSFYFSVITLATVGYGDFTPKTTAGKLFTVVYILIGLGVIASFITALARYQRADRRLLRPLRRQGRAQDEDDENAAGG